MECNIIFILKKYGTLKNNIHSILFIIYLRISYSTEDDILIYVLSIQYDKLTYPILFYRKLYKLYLILSFQQTLNKLTYFVTIVSNIFKSVQYYISKYL